MKGVILISLVVFVGAQLTDDQLLKDLLPNDELPKCSKDEVYLPLKGLCSPSCSVAETCGGGKCVNGECVCDLGYIYGAERKVCLPNCGFLGCVTAGGRCDGVGVCVCNNKGYFNPKTLTCIPRKECEGDCSAKVCSNGKCECVEGYELMDGKCQPTCQGRCDQSKGLKCGKYGICTCEKAGFNVGPSGNCERNALTGVDLKCLEFTDKILSSYEKEGVKLPKILHPWLTNEQCSNFVQTVEKSFPDLSKANNVCDTCAKYGNDILSALKSTDVELPRSIMWNNCSDCLNFYNDVAVSLNEFNRNN